LFLAMLRSAGLAADRLLVTDRRRGVFASALYAVPQLDAEVVEVQAGDKHLFLDPATYLCPFPLLPWNEAGAGGVRAGYPSSALQKTPPSKSADAVTESKTVLHLTADGTLEGALELSITGQTALEERTRMREEDEAGKRRALENDIKRSLGQGASVELLSSSGWQSPYEPLRQKYKISIPNDVVRTPRRILLPIAPITKGEPNPFRHGARVHPVFLDFAAQRIDETTLELPAGYEVEALPKPRKIATPFASWELSAITSGRTIVVKRRLTVETADYTAGQYPGLRIFFNEVSAGDQDRAVLKLVAQAGAPH